MNTRRRKWKKRLIWATTVLLLLIGILAAFVFARFHFSHGAFPFFARMQWSPPSQPESELNKPQIIGHRGSGLDWDDGRYIGNTARAIQAGIDAGVDWVEIDVRASGDGQLVVFHDQRIDDKTNKAGKVAELTLAQLQDAQVLVNPRETILTLDEVFTEFHSEQRKWVLDIKTPGIRDQVLAWLNARRAQGLAREQLILFGTYDILQEYKNSGYKLGYTVVWRKTGNRLRVLFAPGKIIERCEELGCEYLVLPTIFANQSLIRLAGERGLIVWTYGTFDEEDLAHSAGRGISGLIVDRPEFVIKYFDP